MNQYAMGSAVRITGQFKDSSQTLIDPGTVVLRVKDPDGLITTPNPVHDSLGNYHADLVVGKEGYWFYRWEGTGGAVSAASPDGQMKVLDSNVL